MRPADRCCNLVEAIHNMRAYVPYYSAGCTNEQKTPGCDIGGSDISL